VSILAGEIASPSEKRIRANSIEAALVGFYRSRIFRNLAPNTQRMVRTSLERDVRQIIGGAPLAHLGPKQIKDLLDDKAQTAPAGAKGLFTALRCFTRHCIDAELLAKDPTSGITPPRHRSVGIHTWTEEQVGQFENRWPVGSVPRLAMALHLYTAQRLSDTTRMGWQHVRDGMIHITQQKTGTPVAIPVHPELQRVLDATPRTNLTFLVNTWGRPFTASAYEQRFRKWCNEAGLPQACSSHGLRKAACRRLAEAGCSAYELMAISGHKSLSEAQRYTAAVDRERLARRAIAAITIKSGT